MTTKQRKQTETKEITYFEYICDQCGKEAHRSTYRLALQKCYICGREVCRDCRVGFDSILYIGDYSGDRPFHRMCTRCRDEGEIYQKRYADICDKAEVDREAVIEEWKKDMKERDKK